MTGSMRKEKEHLEFNNLDLNKDLGDVSIDEFEALQDLNTLMLVDELGRIPTRNGVGLIHADQYLEIANKINDGIVAEKTEYSIKQNSNEFGIGAPPYNILKELETLSIIEKNLMHSANTTDAQINALAIVHAKMVAIQPCGYPSDEKTIHAISKNNLGEILKQKSQHEGFTPTFQKSFNEHPNYEKAVKLAINYDQVGPLSQILADSVGIDYKMEFAASPYKIKPVQSDINNKPASNIAEIQQTNPDPGIINTPSTMGSWMTKLKDSDIKQLFAKSPSVKSKTLIEFLDNLQYCDIDKMVKFAGTLSTVENIDKNAAKTLFSNLVKPLTDVNKNMAQKIDAGLDNALRIEPSRSSRSAYPKPGT